MGLYNLSTDLLSSCLLSDVSQTEGCLARLDVDAMVLQAMGGYLKGGQAVSGLPLISGRGTLGFLFSCAADSDDASIRKYSLFQQAFSVSDFFTNSQPNACGAFLRECFSRGKSIVST